MMFRPAIAAMISVLTAAPALAIDRADKERVRETPRHFMCKLDRRFLGNVHTPGMGSMTTRGLIQQSNDRGSPVPATIEMWITPASKNGNGVATGGLWPDFVSPSRRPTHFELEKVSITFSSERQTISFVLKSDMMVVPLSIVEAPSRQWWLSLSSAVYPNTRTHDYLCEDIPS
jgi:hypothetical protein